MVAKVGVGGMGTRLSNAVVYYMDINTSFHTRGAWCSHTPLNI